MRRAARPAKPARWIRDELAVSYTKAAASSHEDGCVGHEGRADDVIIAAGLVLAEGHDPCDDLATRIQGFVRGQLSVEEDGVTRHRAAESAGG